jgi:hypothetical protein
MESPDIYDENAPGSNANLILGTVDEEKMSARIYI